MLIAPECKTIGRFNQFETHAFTPIREPSSQPIVTVRDERKKRTKSIGKSASVWAPFRNYKNDTLPPPEEQLTYQGLDVTQLPSNQIIQREPRRRAVVVGCNYSTAPDVMLKGACNDAATVALTLINMCEFQLYNVILLVDTFPAECYRFPNLDPSQENEEQGFIAWKERQPTRRNILLALNWLRADTIPGDVLLFFFAGHGIQVDDMSGWEGEGYDEAILPLDFYGDEVNVITAVMIRNLLLNVANNTQVTIVLDCNGGQTMLDPYGTGSWNYIKGVKQRGVWPFITDATDKVARAVYDPVIWTDEAMRKRDVRPRFVPGVDISSTQDLLDPTLQKPASQLNTKVRGYLIASAPWGQTAVEARMPIITLSTIDRKCKILSPPKLGTPKKKYAYHVSLRELLLKSVRNENNKAITFGNLMREIDRRIKQSKTSPSNNSLIKLDQQPEITYYRSGGGEARDLFLWPFGGRQRDTPFVLKVRSPIALPLVPHEQHYLSTWEAEEELRYAGEVRRMNDPAFAQYRKRKELMSAQQGTYQTNGWNSSISLDPTSSIPLDRYSLLTSSIQPLVSESSKLANTSNNRLFTYQSRPTHNTSSSIRIMGDSIRQPDYVENLTMTPKKPVNIDHFPHVSLPSITYRVTEALKKPPISIVHTGQHLEPLHY